MKCLYGSSGIGNVILLSNMNTKDEWSNKVIQMVPMKDGNHLFIVDFEIPKYKLSYRKGKAPNLLISTLVSVNETTVIAEGFDFHVSFLNSFIFHNSEHYDELIPVSTKE